MNSTGKTFGKEASYKNLRMGNYMNGSLASSSTNFKAASSSGFQPPRSASRSKMSLAKSPSMRNMSASKLQSRASIAETSFQG